MGSTSAEPAAKRQKVAKNQLEALKEMTSVVADTGDLAKIKAFTPEDATTNPTLLLQACQMPEYKAVVDAAIEKAKKLVPSSSPPEELINEICDQLAVTFGCEILKIIPGYVSTEVDANLSFDAEKSVEKARKLIKMYEAAGYKKDRILIKLGSTWESIRACEILQKEGIKCNMTLLFSFCQAVACAEAGATLISPFVGRILDWYKQKFPTEDYVSDPENDPGVKSVKRIYEYYRQNGYKTLVMGASFRNSGEILALAGCDKLTIGPKFLDELEKNTTDAVVRKLDPANVANGTRDTITKLDEKTFRWQLNEDAMATEKLSEGIRNFNKDLEKLQALLRDRICK